jgi:2'-5' RNA ligase
MYYSSGAFLYSPPNLETGFYKAIVEVDPDLVNYYRWWIPRSVKSNRQAYKPHISVIRKETIAENRRHLWGKYEGESVEFSYDNKIYFDETYIWLEVHSERLMNIRTELGLYPSRTHPDSPNDFCFHITIGNFKGLVK